MRGLSGIEPPRLTPRGSDVVGSAIAFGLALQPTAAVTAIPVDDPPSAPTFAQEGAPTATPGYLSIDEYTLCTTTQLDLTPWRVACLEAEISGYATIQG